MIKGLETLSEDQKELLYRVNKLHTDCVGNDYKADMKVTEVWIDENNCVCARLKSGEWYHYTKQGTWY